MMAYKNMKTVKRINENQLRAIVAESVKKVLYEQEQLTFSDYFNRSRAFHQKYGGYGFEFKKDGEWKYGDIEYDPKAQTMSCVGVVIRVTPEMTISDAEDDLYEALLDAGYKTDF